MYKPIFDVLLSRREWVVLKALRAVGRSASTRAVHRRLPKGHFALSTVHLTLGDLAQCQLIERTRAQVDIPNGPTRLTIWTMNDNGRKFFP
jgi:predicted transcriptional regulator